MVGPGAIPGSVGAITAITRTRRRERYERDRRWLSLLGQAAGCLGVGAEIGVLVVAATSMTA
jgi:hypothetical protein